MLFLDSIGIDFLSLIHDYPPVVSASLSDIKSTVEFVTSMGFTAVEFRRIVGMCPEVLTSRVADIVPVLTFLIREARVNGLELKRVINRRPRLLACSVKDRLRPTLYFLQSIGISEVNRYTNLLSCSVEEKLIPRIEYLEKIGFSHRDALSMFRRFPQLFCYSIKDNFEPKFDYFVVEMGRDLKDLKEFPHYFSFSLENRIKPRHQICVEKGVCFPLPILLKTNEAQFRDRLEEEKEVCTVNDGDVSRASSQTESQFVLLISSKLTVEMSSRNSGFQVIETRMISYFTEGAGWKLAVPYHIEVAHVTKFQHLEEWETNMQTS
ncbi:hypothetical protein FEM48_Zijuj01G0165200 [Ziziphus jujuba var. spinosa]|uniref:Transcription termination factor MTEF1, chloroplastic-like n=1 Tax=Ziziphus jujuba var. spinosa TaxID=714518 RepID=A0A978U8Q8_ZIZJJ|nr:hypothetical protein FEM48_ZijujUnG0078000 [Ziziphus jujuba var. spinosa]KAH7546104.1 hypothetical protein FEM48_Zijuj01G0165200 [Ziziphus jujuba var. spinosa]